VQLAYSGGISGAVRLWGQGFLTSLIVVPCQMFNETGEAPLFKLPTHHQRL